MNRLKSHSKGLMWFLALLLPVLIYGCGGGTLAGGGRWDPSSTPMVNFTAPANNATGVADNQTVTAGFTEVMAPATINAATFTLRQGLTGVAGTVTYSGATATFRPAANLAHNTLYTATITTGAKDLEGNPMAANYVWTFTTGADPDDTPPTVTSTGAANGAINLPVNRSSSAVFSEVMDPATLNNATYTLTGPGNAPVAGTVTYSGVTAVFKPAVNLAFNTLYTATITTGARDLAGNPMAANYVWSWRTGDAPDNTAPTVIHTGTPNGATGVPVNMSSSATFSEDMDPATISTATYRVTGAGGAAVVGTVSYAGVTAVFTPAVNLAFDTVYTATITTGSKDLAGNPMAQDYVWSWRTAADPNTNPIPNPPPATDNTAPTIIATGVYGTSGATSGATNLPINRSGTVVFSEPMRPQTITTVTYTVTGPGLTPVLGAVTYSGVTATFRPLNLLQPDTLYTSTISVNVRDLAGNRLAQKYVWTWRTGAAPDTTAPTVLSTVPVNAAVAVPLNQEITAIFSEAMDPLTITTLTYTVTGPGLTPVNGNVAYAGVTATFTPASLLTANTTYTATVTTDATDLAGVHLASGFAPNPWTFTTAAVLPPAGPAAVNLDCATGFGILAGSTVTNTGPTIISNGDVGLSPGSSVTGFPPGTVTGGTIRINDTLANNAKLCLTTAFNDAAGRTLAPITVSGNIGGQTLAPGIYKSTSTLAISSGDLTLAGPADAVWIFQVASTLTTTSGRQVILSGGAQAKNVFWQVGTSATIGTTSHFVGNIMADQSITLETGAVLDGRALTRIGAVSLDSSLVNVPAP
jgi:hypothetical protein